MTLEAWKQTFTVKFPQENQEKSALPEDPGRDPNYAEPDVDNLRSQKDEVSTKDTQCFLVFFYDFQTYKFSRQ